MIQYITQSAEETIEFGKNIGSKLVAGDLVLLFGDLGSGKTCLTQGICQGVGLKKGSYIRSPTFTLINEYQAKIPIFHVDLYRLEEEAELINLGLEEIIYSQAITIIEWAEKLKTDKKPNELNYGIQDRLEIHISSKQETLREFNLLSVNLSPREPSLFPLH
tara:strand:+ start:123 stop:608 length:486 start_codon:yes stop_codon:yes gene_type:complete